MRAYNHVDAYSKFRMFLSKLNIYKIRKSVNTVGGTFHFMRMGEFDYCDKWEEIHEQYKT